MLKEVLIRRETKEQVEDEIMFLQEHNNARVLIKPYTYNQKEWFATVIIEKR